MLVSGRELRRFCLSALRAHVVGHIGCITLTKLDGSALNRLWAELALSGKKTAKPGGVPQGLSAKSVENVAMTVHRLLRDAVRWGEDPQEPGRDGGPAEAVSDSSSDHGVAVRHGPHVPGAHP